MTITKSSRETNKSELVMELPRLQRFTRLLTRDRDRAEDLLQDVLERALGALHRKNPAVSLRAWLFTIARNRHIDGVRRDASSAKRFCKVGQARQGEFAAEELTTSFALDIEAAIQTLDPDLQKVLWLIALQQLSYEEAATRLAVPVGTVRSRLYSRAARNA